MSRTRQKIDSLIDEYKAIIRDVTDGYATLEQQENIQIILNELVFYTHRVLIFDREK